MAEYELGGAIEHDVGNGRVSMDAPFGRALVDRRSGEIVDADAARDAPVRDPQRAANRERADGENGCMSGL